MRSVLPSDSHYTTTPSATADEGFLATLEFDIQHLLLPLMSSELSWLLPLHLDRLLPLSLKVTWLLPHPLQATRPLSHLLNFTWLLSHPLQATWPLSHPLNLTWLLPLICQLFFWSDSIQSSCSAAKFRRMSRYRQDRLTFQECDVNFPQ